MNVAAPAGREDENVAVEGSLRFQEIPDERLRHYQERQHHTNLMNVAQQLRGVDLPPRSASMPPPSSRKKVPTGTSYHNDDNNFGKKGKIATVPHNRTPIHSSTTTTTATTNTTNYQEMLQTIQDTTDATEGSETEASFDVELFPIQSSSTIPASSHPHNLEDGNHVAACDSTEDDNDDHHDESTASREDSSELWQDHDSIDDDDECVLTREPADLDDERKDDEVDIIGDLEDAVPFDEADVYAPCQQEQQQQVKQSSRSRLKNEKDKEDQVDDTLDETKVNDTIKQSKRKGHEDDEKKTFIQDVSLQQARYGDEKVTTGETTVVMIDQSMGDKDLKIANYRHFAAKKSGSLNERNISLAAARNSYHDDIELGGHPLTALELPSIDDDDDDDDDDAIKADKHRVVKGTSWPRLGQRRERVRSEAMRLASQPGAEYVRGRAPGQIPVWILQSYRESSARLQEEMRQQSLRSNVGQEEEEEETQQVAVDAHAVLPRQVQHADCVPAAGDEKVKKTRWWIVAVVLLVIIAAAVGVAVGVSTSGDSSAKAPQQQGPDIPQSPTGPAIYYNSIECSSVNRTATTTSTPTNVLSQCYCDGTIDSTAPQTNQRYRAFQQTLSSTLVTNGFNETASSCAPSNIALWFLAEDEVGTTNATTNLEQRYVLALHYLVMNGRTWYNASGWFSSLPECEWQGITCNDQGLVNAIELSVNNLTGILPSSIGLLSALEVLDLSVNHVRGSIPSQIGRLTTLQRLELSSNDLTGSLPSQVNNLVSLESMHLNSNGIRGTLPALTGLVQLVDLQLTGNQLSGSLPSREWFPDNLRTIALDSNGLTGSLRSFEGMSELVSLNLNNNSFVSEYLPPSFWTNWTSLEQLSLEDMQLRGPVADLFQNLKHLVFADLAGNNFTGTLPTEIGELKDLTLLVLYNNQLTGHIPTELGLCTSLEKVDLSSNRLVGRVPTQLGSLSKLAFLYFNENDLSGTIPQQVCSLQASALQDLEADCPLCGKTKCCYACTTPK